MAMALDTLLEPLKELSQSGVVLDTLKDGKVNAYPRLMSYVADDPELKDLTGIKGLGSLHPCDACWVDKDNLINIEHRWPVRTEVQQTLIWEANSARLQRLAEPEDLDDFLRSKLDAVHPVPSGLWGFKGQQDGVGNSMLSMGYESMHIEDLGISLYLVDYMRAYLTSVKGISSQEAQKLLNKLNNRMSLLPRAGMVVKKPCKTHIATNTFYSWSYNAEDFQLPYCKGEYFDKHTHVQAKEHRNVIQVLPHLLNGLDQDLTVLAIR
jgi:hypothetical protein